MPAVRFGVVAPVGADAVAWKEQVRRVADWGYSTVLMPDVPQWDLSPGASLAVAASVAEVRVGTWVYASPLRPPWTTAWEAHSLTELTDGRFEMGIGTGRPGIEDELRDLRMPVTPRSERLTDVRETIERLRTLDGGGRHTPVVMAVHGPKAKALAAEVADTVTFAVPADVSRAEVTALAGEFSSERVGRDIELALHVPVIGTSIAPFMASPRETDPAAMRAADSLAWLSSDPAEAIEELHRRHEEIGYTYFVIGAAYAETLAPVVSQLAGRTG